MAAVTRAFPRLPVVVILGCTGTGKSKLAIEIGKRIGGEIISADSMQVYKGLDIITNKVTTEEMRECKHHMIDFVSPLNEFSVVDFRNMALPLIEEIKGRGKIPIVVGGTNYYIESLLWEILIDNDNKPPENSDVDDDGELQIVDPVMARRIHPNDTRKIARSLQVFEQHGRPHSELLAEQQSKDGGSAYGGPLRFDLTCVFWLHCEKEILNKRLDSRVDAMLDKGLVQELLEFHGSYNKLRQDDNSRYSEGIFQSIGFKEFHNFLVQQQKGDTVNSLIKEEDKKVFDECVEAMKAVTRRYAKKQTMWVKNRFLSRPIGSSPNVYELDATDLSSWESNVLDRGLGILENLLQDKQPSVDPIARIIRDQQSTHVQHTCEVCDNRVIIGDKNWASHLVSKSHKWHLKKQMKKSDKKETEKELR
ncbi:predicted protein [Nematostella vectensis]|uniref:tRNA dimethylallyltransferase n=1 Tax=Nematostella vectensis TaxID=45351 RepID=A7S8N3_NEMVE|nr:predicted protein [Nematostella vectensis]|eukprot:XP_001631919.1 predicted protein [Nematostella vectensis]